jgi:type IV pilus assembly protein PilF
MMHTVSRLLIAALCLALLACGTSPGGRPNERASRNAEAAKTQVALGVGYLERGNFEESLTRFERAIKFDPSSADAHTGLGLLYERIDNLKNAESAYRRAAKLNPKRGDLRNNLGQFLCRTGRMEESQAEFEAALEDPFYKTPEVAAANAGRCAELAGDYANAERYLRVALDRNPNAHSVMIPMAKVLYKRGEHMRARAFVQRYESSDQPINEDMLVLAEQIERKLGATQQADQYAARRAKEFPNRSEETPAPVSTEPESAKEAEQSSEPR